LGLPALSDPELRQGPAHADQEARQRRPHDAHARAGHRRLGVRGALTVVAAVALTFASPAPAAPPPHALRFINVPQPKGLLDRGTKADIIDGRHWEQFVESHIKGARSMPLRVVNDRASEISKTGLVVFY